MARVIERRTIRRQKLLQLQIRLVHEVAVEIERCVVGRVVTLLRGQIQPRFELFMLHGQPDLAPLVDQEHADRRIRHRDVAVGQLEGQILGSGLLQQFARLVARGVDIARKPRQLDQIRFAGREVVTRAQQPADVPHQRDFLQRLCAAPAIDRQRERAAHARIVERLFLGVEAHHQAASPRRFDHHRLVAKRLHQAIPVGRRMAAEFRQHLARGQCVHHRRAAHEYCAIAIEVRLAFLEVAVELAAHPVRAGLVLDERERAGAENVALGKLGIGLELGRAVHAVPRRRKVRQHRCVGLRQLEYHR